jgi:hypothetical protein
MTARTLVLFCGIAALPAFADVTYTSSAAYAAATAGLISVVDETYGSLAVQDIASGATLDGITYSNFTGGYTDADITDQYNGFTANSLGADNTAAFGPDDTFFIGGQGITLTFSSPVSAVGVFFNVSPDSGQYGFTTNTGGSAFTGSASYDNDIVGGTFVFAGIVSDATFTSVTLQGDSSYNVPEVEASVAESGFYGPLALDLGVALGGLAIAFGRRRKALAQ